MAYPSQRFGFDTTLMPVYEGNEAYRFDSFLDVQANEEDILSDISPAAMLAAENVNDAFQFNVIPPSRVNTQNVGDEEFGLTFSGQDEDLSWERMVISAGEDTPIPASSRGGSVPPSEVDTLFSDSGFVSLRNCEQCQEKYKNPSLRKKHILKHIKPYRCTSAGCKRNLEGFATPNDLLRHAKSVHKEGPQEWFKCDYPKCDKTNKDHFFDRKDNFIAHIKRRHDDLQGSAIESLVRDSQYKPTADEVNAALLAKNQGPSRTLSGRQIGSRAARKQKARSERSDDVSVCSSPPIDTLSYTQPLDIPNSAPEMSHLNSGYRPLDELAGIGGGVTNMLGLQAASGLGGGKARAMAFTNSQQSLYSRPASASHSFSFAAQRLGTAQRPPSRQNPAPTSAPREIFQTIPQGKYAMPRSFTSNLSNQLQQQHPASFPTMHQGFADAMESGHGRRQTQPTFQAGMHYPGMTQTLDMFRGDSAFSPCGSSQVSLSESFDPALQPPLYQDSYSSSSFSQSFDADTFALPLQSSASSSFNATSFNTTSFDAPSMDATSYDDVSFDPLECDLQGMDLDGIASNPNFFGPNGDNDMG